MKVSVSVLFGLLVGVVVAPWVIVYDLPTFSSTQGVTMPAYTWTDATLATSLPPTAVLATSFRIPVGAIACHNLVVDLALERTLGVNARDPSFVSMWIWRGTTVLDGSVPFNITSPPLVWQGNVTPPTSMLTAPGSGTRTHRLTLPPLPTSLLSSITYWLGVSVGTARGYHLSTRTFNAWRWRTTIDNVSAITTPPYKAIDRFGTAGALQYPALINWTNASMAEVWVSAPSGMISLTHELAATIYGNCTGPSNQSAPNVLPNGTFPPVFVEASSSVSPTSNSPSLLQPPSPLPTSAPSSSSSSPSPSPLPQPVSVPSPTPLESPPPLPASPVYQQGIPSPLFSPIAPPSSSSSPSKSSSSSSSSLSSSPSVSTFPPMPTPSLAVPTGVEENRLNNNGSITLSRQTTIILGLVLGIGMLCIAVAIIVCVAQRKLFTLGLRRLQMNKFNEEYDILDKEEPNAAISLESMDATAGRTSEDADSLEDFKDAPNISSTIAAFPSPPPPPSVPLADAVSDDDDDDHEDEDLERRRMQTIPLSYTSTGAPKLSPATSDKQQQLMTKKKKRKGNEGGGGSGKK